MSDRNDVMANVIFALIVVVVLAIGLGWWIYRSNVQAALWQREGIEISTWEVMVGAKPAQRLIEVK